MSLHLKPIVKRGTTRVVWVFPQFGFAIKFPVFFFKNFFKSLWHFRRKWKYLYKFFTYESEVHHSARFCMFKGLLDNWREFIFFISNSKQPFLLPTYFSFFGIFTVSAVGKEIPDEIRLYSFIYNATDGDSGKDGHHFAENNNFCFFKGYIRMRDYGSKRTQEIIAKHWENLNSLPTELILG